MFVTTPNDPLRGIRPSWMTRDKTFETVESEPLPKGTFVWYIKDNARFEWYIPAIVKSYILKGDEVVKYELSIDETKGGFGGGWMDKSVKEAKEAVSAADPLRVVERWDEETIPCPIQGFDDKQMAKSWDEGSDDSIDLIKAQGKYGMDLGFQGAKQVGHGPEMWGITLEQLEDVVHDESFDRAETSAYGGERLRGGMTMYEVVQKIIKPKTKGQGMGYSLLMNKEKPLRAKVMVSHAWGEDYERFLATLKESGSAGPFWICAMSIYQNEDITELTISKQLGPQPSTGPFSTVLKQSSKMIAIVTPDCDIYTRLWCVYEIFMAVQLGVSVELAFFSESTGWGGSGQTYFNAGMDSANLAVNTKEATCSSESDQLMIANQVSEVEGGFDLLDSVVYWIKSKALIDAYRSGRVAGQETTATVPFGVSSASCVTARLNAAIYKIYANWKPSGQIPNEALLVSAPAEKIASSMRCVVPSKRSIHSTGTISSNGSVSSRTGTQRSLDHDIPSTISSNVSTNSERSSIGGQIDTSSKSIFSEMTESESIEHNFEQIIINHDMKKKLRKLRSRPVKVMKSDGLVKTGRTAKSIEEIYAKTQEEGIQRKRTKQKWRAQKTQQNDNKKSKSKALSTTNRPVAHKFATLAVDKMDELVVRFNRLRQPWRGDAQK